MFVSARLKVSFLLFTVALMTGSLGVLHAQQGQSLAASKEVKVKITHTANGKTTSQTHTQTVSGTPNLNDLLIQHGVSEELGNMADGEAVEIIIRRKMPAGQPESMTIEVEPQQVKPAAPAVAATPAPKPAAIATDRDFAYLGVKYNDLAAGHPIMTGIPEVRGALVDRVYPGTSAEQNGLMSGDVIAAVNDVHLTEDRSIHDLIGEYQAGDQVRVTIYRNQRKRTVTLVLGEVGKNPVYRYDYDNATGRVRMLATNVTNTDQVAEEEAELSAAKASAPTEKNEPPYAHLPVMERAYLGVNGAAGEEDESDGAQVVSVMRNSTGEALGLMSGDLITSLNGAPIQKFADLSNVLEYVAPGDLVTVEMNRKGELRSATARIKSKRETFLPPAPEESKPIAQTKTSPTQANAQAPVKWEVYKEVKMMIVLKDATAQEAESISGRSGMDISAQNSLNIKGLNMFPNPNEGIFTLTFDLPEEGDTEIRFLDANGKLIYAEDLPGFSGNYEKQLDFSDREKGIYFLRIVQSGQPMLKKIVLQ